MMQPTYKDEILNNYPQPLAATYARFIDQRDPAAQHNLLLALFEVTLKYLAAVGLAEHTTRGNSDSSVAEILDRLSHPSLGHWAALLRVLLVWRDRQQLAPADAVFPQLATLYAKPSAQLPAAAALMSHLRRSGFTPVSLRQLFDALVEYRNQLAHGAGQGAAHYAVVVPLLQAALEELLLAIPALAGRPLAFVDNISIDAAGTRNVSLLRLMSDRPRLRPQQVALAPADANPIPQQLYLLPEGSMAGALPLQPLLTFLPACSSCGDAQVGVLNGLTAKAAEYLCYGCGHANYLADALASVSSYFERFAGSPQSAAPPLVEQRRPVPEEGDAAVTASPMPALNNLPLQPTAFIGREKELSELDSLLGQPSTRLITLIGPGGTGKTRLALQVAMAVAPAFPDGVWFVDLSPVAEAKSVVPALAQVLGVKEPPGQALLDTLKLYLQEKQLLLLLDNFEQVIEAATQLSQLLAASAGLKLLVTSRIALRIRGEKQYPVAPLQLPDPQHLPPPDQLAEFEAVRLFVARATDVKPDFQLTAETAPAVAEICLQLDGLPLAIELAAARVRLFTPQALLGRLSSRLKLLTGGARDLPARQQTLRGAIEWSYDLLDAGEQQLFRRLAVFSGGGTLEALEAVCNYDGGLGVDILEGVDSLVSKSLLTEQEGGGTELRFVLLKTIQEYALEQLSASGEGERLAAEHAGYYLNVAEQAAPGLTGRERAISLARLAAEHDNLRTALTWSAGGSERTETMLRLVTSLYYFWWFRNYIGEGREWQERVLVQPEVARYPELRADCLWQVAVFMSLQGVDGIPLLRQAVALARALGAKRTLANALAVLGGQLGWRAGDEAEIRAVAEESIALLRQVGDQWQLAICLFVLSGDDRAGLRGGADGSGARARMEESRAIFSALGDKWGLALATNSLAAYSMQHSDISGAFALYEQALALARELGDKWLEINVWGSMAHACRVIGETRQATQYLQEQLTLARELGTLDKAASALHTLGYMAMERGDYEQAQALCEQGLAMAQKIGDKEQAAWALRNLGRVAWLRGNRPAAMARATESMKLAHEMHMRGGIGLCLADLAEELSGEQPEVSARLLGAADAQLEGIHAYLDRGDATRLERSTAELRERLGAERFAVAWAEGQAMGPEAAVVAAQAAAQA